MNNPIGLSQFQTLFTLQEQPQSSHIANNSSSWEGRKVKCLSGLWDELCAIFQQIFDQFIACFCCCRSQEQALLIPISPSETNNISYADHHQMDAIYSHHYTERQQSPDSRRSACSMIAGEFVQQFLAGAGYEELEQIMEAGQQKMAESNESEGVIFDEIINSSFPNLELIPLNEEMLAINGVGEIAFDRQLGKNGFRAAIEFLQELKRTNELSSIGAVLTNPPESYAIVIKDDQIIFFDSHGDMPQNQGLVKGNAYSIIFSSSNEAAEFLAKRLPALDWADSRCQSLVSLGTILSDTQLDMGNPFRIIKLFPLKLKQTDI